MTFYAIRHVKTQKLMPEPKTRGGYSHWNPDNPKMPKIFSNIPRLIETRKSADRCIVQWFFTPNARRSIRQDHFGEYDEDIDIKNDGRKKEDLEVVEVELFVKEKKL